MASRFIILSAILCISCFGYTSAQSIAGADIAFVLDGSGSVGRENYFNVFLPFIQEIAERLPLSSSLYQIGIVAFGNEGEVQMEFNSSRNDQELDQWLSDETRVKYLQENTNTTGGILVMRTELFTNKSAGAREDVAKIAILMTDGPATRDSDTLDDQARMAREAGITMFVMGIRNPGQDPLNEQQLREVASDPDESYLIIVDSFEDMADRMDGFAQDMTVAIQEIAQDSGDERTTTSTTTTTTTTRPQTTPDSTTTTRRDQTRPRPTTTTTTTTTPGPQEAEWECEFENEEGNPTTCGMMSDREADFVWLPRAGRTPSQNTGPNGAYRGSVYMYMESSPPRAANDEAVLYVPKRVFDGRQCVSFAAQMTGEDIGRLQVMRVTRDGGEDVLFSASGEQTRGQWFERSLETVINGDDRGLAFRGVVGNGYRGDIALDFIRVRSGSC